MHGNERHLNMTAFVILDLLRHYSYISIRKPGLTSGASMTNIRTISGTRSSPRMCTGDFALTWRVNSQISATTYGASLLPIRLEDTWCGEDPLPRDRSMEPLFLVLRQVRCRSCRTPSCACCTR